MRKLFSLVWPLLAIFLICLIFFYPFFLQNKVPLPADIIVGVSYPWLDYKFDDFPLGVPVKNPIISDAISLIFPMRHYAIEQLKKGFFPLWNDLIFAGTPLFANFQSAVLSPTNFFFVFFDELKAWGLSVFLQPFLASIFLYLLLRTFALSKLSSLVGGVIFGFSGLIMIFLEWNTISLVAATFPGMLLLITKFLKTKNPFYGVLLSITLALQIFAGYPQIIMYEIVAIVLLILFFFRQLTRNLNNLFLILVFLLLGIGLAAILLIPAMELLNLSQRELELIPDEWTYLPWPLLITFFAPDFFGNHTTYNYWGPANYTLSVGYTGIIAIFLALLAVMQKFSELGIKIGLMFIGLSLLLSTQNPLTILLKQTGLVGLQAGAYHRSLFLFNLGVATTASFGLDLILTKKIYLKDLFKAALLPFIFLIGAGLVTLVSFYNQENQQIINNLIVGLKNLILPVTFLVLAIFVVFISNRFQKAQKIGILILIVLVIAELFRFGWKFTTFSPKKFVFPKTPIIDFLTKKEKPFRTLASFVVPTNFMMVYGIETIEGYDAVYPLRFAKYLAVLNSNDPGSSPQDRYGAVSKIDSSLLDVANVKYILALKENSQMPEKFQLPHLSKIFEDKSTLILENTKALPRFKMFYDWEVIEEDEPILARLIGDFPTDQKIILESDPGVRKDKGVSKIDLLNYNQEHKLEVSTTKPGILYIANSFYPGWKALVNGQSTPILRANYNFMAIPVKEGGSHIISLKYEPDSFKIGKMISLISLGILIGISLWIKRWQLLFLIISLKKKL